MSSLKLNSLLEITKAINNNTSTADLLATYQDVLKEKLNIGKLVLYGYESKWTCLLKYGVDDEHTQINVERDLLWINEINVVDFNEKNPVHHSFEIVIPVFHKQQPLAYVLIGDIDDDRVEVSPVIKHLPFVQTLTNIIVVAIENKKLYKESIQKAALRKELELASQMQHMLFPESLPDNEQTSFDALYLPHQEVGGDYYDFIWLNRNEFAFCMADVSGKGVAAALLMSNFQANLRVLLNYTNSLSELVRELNAKVMSNAKGEKFITFFIAKYNIQTRILTYVNAGHNPPILLNGKSTLMLRAGCTGLGMFDELIKVKEGILPISENSLILCYTDGVVEVENEEEESYGSDRLIADIKQAKKLDVNQINQNILFNIINFKGSKPYIDDIALFCGKIR
jgi:sigma-B regulation protein RsbU (phosphoserine phosphatase)